MPTLDFKGKHHIYAHHLTVPYRPLVPEPDQSVLPSEAPDGTNVHSGQRTALILPAPSPATILSSTATTCTP